MVYLVMLFADSHLKMNGERIHNIKLKLSLLRVDDHIIETACHVLHKLPEMPVYARVDGTIINNQFLLNELELIEPALYLDRWEGATERFVDVLKTRITKQKL